MKMMLKSVLSLGTFAMLLGCQHAPPVPDTAKADAKSSQDFSANADKKNEGGEILLDMADAKPMFSVCNEIYRSFDIVTKYPKKTRTPKAKRTIAFLVESNATEPSLLYQYRVPEVRAFIKWSDKAGDNYWTLPEYKVESEKALIGLQKALPFAKRVDVRSYYATMLARIMMLRPAFAKSPAVKETCQYIENSLMDGDDAQLPIKMQALLKKARVLPNEIGFDPAWQSSIEVRDLGQLPEYDKTFSSLHLKEHLANQKRFKLSEGE
jgi:hypothetical protein